MGRPKKEYRISRNGNSIQLYENGEYCGSLPVAWLCELARGGRLRDAILTQEALSHKEFS